MYVLARVHQPIPLVVCEAQQLVLGVAENFGARPRSSLKATAPVKTVGQSARGTGEVGARLPRLLAAVGYEYLGGLPLHQRVEEELEEQRG